jgi:2-oxoglutarate ferredoxin oxidoreductase subunit gamma
MNQASLAKYEHRLETEGLLLINSSLVDPREVTRKDVHILSIPANDLAKECGNAKLANMVALGAFIEKVRWIQMSSLFNSFEGILDQRYHSLIPSNIDAIQKGADFARSLQ